MHGNLRPAWEDEPASESITRAGRTDAPPGEAYVAVADLLKEEILSAEPKDTTLTNKEAEKNKSSAVFLMKSPSLKELPRGRRPSLIQAVGGSIEG